MSAFEKRVCAYTGPLAKKPGSVQPILKGVAPLRLGCMLAAGQVRGRCLKHKGGSLTSMEHGKAVRLPMCSLRASGESSQRFFRKSFVRPLW